MSSIGSVTSVHADLSEMLSKIREVSAKNKAFTIDKPESIGVASSHKSSFESVMSSAKGVFDQVNTIQSQTDDVKNAFLMGDKKVSMADVIVSSQKSKLAFEGLITVRNKILDAYKEIMSMPV